MTGPNCIVNGCHNKALLNASNELMYKGYCISCAKKDNKYRKITIFIISTVVIIMSIKGCVEIVSMYIE